MKKSTIYFSILLVLALCCAQFAAASIVFKDSVVVSAGQRDSVPSGATWMVDYVRVEYGGTLEVQPGALLIVTSQPGIITEGADALVLRAQTDSQPMGKLLINPVVTTNNHPSLTVKTKSDSYMSGSNDNKWHCLGFPMLSGMVNSFACEDQSVQKVLYYWGSYTQSWTNMQSIAGIEPFQGYKMLLNTATPGHVMSMTGDWLGQCDTTLHLGAGFNLLANSFTSEMYVSKILPTLSSQYPQAVWLSDDGGNTYDVHNDVARNLSDVRIEPLEPFVLYNVDNFSSTFTYSYSTMVYQPKLLEASGSSNTPSATETNYTAWVKLTLTDGNGASRWVVVAENPALTEMDACPMYMSNSTSDLYVRNGTMACQTLVVPQLGDVQLDLKTSSSSTTYTITATGVTGQNLRLIDNLTGDEISLSEGTTYSFTAAAGTTITDRFTLTNRASVAPTICHRYGKLQVTGSNGMTVSVLNLDGTATSLGSVNITSDYQEIDLAALPMGDYKVEWNGQTIIVFNPDGAWLVASRTYDDSIPCVASPNTTLKDSITLGETCLFGCQLITPTGLDTVVYDSLTNVCGEDSVIVMMLNVYNPPIPCEETSSEVSVSVCEGETIVWNGRTYYQSGTYVDTLSNWCGADSICTLNLTVLTPREEPMTDYMVCEADLPVMWHGRTLTTTGVYYDTLRYQATGCDSARYTLSLTVVKAIDIQADTTVCEADLPIIWRGRTLTTAGTYRDTLYDNVTGCDSERYTLSLTVVKAIDIQADTTVCEADLPIIWRGRTLTTAGVYYDTLRYQATGCDSARYTLSLTVVKAIDIQADTTVCEADLPIIWRGRTLTTAGTYRDTLYDNVTGCDRERHTLNLFVNSEQTSTEQDAICEGETYTWHNRQLTKPGVYRDTLRTIYGCDSICILNLTVHPSYLIEEIVSVREDKLPYQWQGRNITEAGNYIAEYESVHGCDSIITLQLMVTALPIYSVNVLADHGYVNGTGTYPEGTHITLVAVPDEGFEFQMWSDGTTENPKEFTVMQDTTFRALFFMPEVEQDVTVDSIETNSVTIIWDTVPGAVLYELRIYKNGELVVTYEVDPENNIVGEHHIGPDRIVARKDSTGGSSETLQVSVGGLESGQDYTYSLDALDDDRSFVGAQSGSFTTEAEEPEGLDTLFDKRHPAEPRKVLRDGQLYIILPDGTLYDARGALVD